MFASINTTKAIKDSLVSHGIISKVLPDFANKGSTTLLVEYGNKQPVALGNTLPEKATQEKPLLKLVSEDQLDTSSRYTLCLTDPDAPSKSDDKWSEYCHYLETNIKLSSDGNTPLSYVLNAGQVHTPYMGPAPPKGTGPHRYVWILAQQSPGSEPGPLKDRPNWGFDTPGTGFQHYADQFKLVPIAVNFFYVEHK